MKEIRLGKVTDVRFVGVKPAIDDFRFKIWTADGKKYDIEMTEKFPRIEMYGGVQIMLTDGSDAWAKSPVLAASFCRLMEDEDAFDALETGDPVPLFNSEAEAVKWNKEHGVGEEDIVLEGVVDINGREVA